MPRPVNPNKCHLELFIASRWLKRYSLDKTTTLKELKQLISSEYLDIPTERLTLTIPPQGTVIVHDDQDTLASFGIAEGQTTKLEVEIARMHVAVRFTGYSRAKHFVDCYEFDRLSSLTQRIVLILHGMGKEHVGPDDLVMYLGHTCLSEPTAYLFQYGIGNMSLVDVKVVTKVTTAPPTVGAVQRRPASAL